MKLLALSGSLRRISYNAAALKALCTLASNKGLDVELGDVGCLPLFNPDLEDKSIPAVDALKSSLGSASGLIIASPEYAHGISGPMKNAFHCHCSVVVWTQVALRMMQYCLNH